MKSVDTQQVFKTFLQQQKLEDQKLLLMVSGGVDSIVLLHAAAQIVAPKDLAVFHLNHNARPESFEDEAFVQNLCTKLNIKFYSETLSEKPAKNTESNWRSQRKILSQKAADNFGAKQILTAHHATDLVETMIFRLTKGCGPSGLSPFDVGTKPFWQLSKQTLINYAAEQNLEWREDHTNQNTHHERNLIRAEVLPALQKITPNLEQVFVRENQIFAQVSDFIAQQLQIQLAAELEQQSIKLEKFLQLHSLLQTELLRSIAAKTPSQPELEDGLKWLRGTPEGNSKKELGGTELQIKAGCILW